jgi:integrase
MAKLTKSFIDNLPFPATGQRIIRDDELPGFALRLTPGSRSWILYYSVNGKRRSITLGSYNVLSPSTAKMAARGVLSDIAMGVDPLAKEEQASKANVTLQTVLTKYLAVRNMKDRTKITYRNYISRHLADWLQLPIKDINKEMVEQRHQDLVGATRCGTEGKSRANGTMQVLRVLFTFAQDYYGFAGTNPVDWLTENRRWFYLAPRQGIVPDHRLKDWYQAVMSLDSKIARDFFLFLMLTGLRRNEAARLLWKDVNFNTGTLLIPESGTKNGKPHTLPLSPFITELLLSRQKEADSDYVFPGRDGGHLNEPRSPKEKIRKIMGWHILFHDYRRTFLTMGTKVGVEYYILKKIANHTLSHADTTARHYVVVSVEDMRPAVNRITDRLLDLMGTSASRWKQYDQNRIPDLTIVVPSSDETELYW